ncbi:MAG: DNA polymerase III subunit chi [Prolixibacteraceae bacterium]|nr:DNA polymerase III subunit chi [Burkholderiales bacterium]
MTEIKFFFNVEHKMAFACRLAKKAYDGGRKLVVYAPQESMADEFDRMLWSFSKHTFIPHVRASHPLSASTPIIVAHSEGDFSHSEALLNLGDAPPPFFSRFQALREIVLADEEDRARARVRAKYYRSRGFEVTHQDVAVNG